MNETDRCTKCGAPLVSGGLCSRCVLGFAMEGATEPAGGPPSQALPSGTTVGPYEIRGVLGRGGMGVVYRARHAALDRAVALKVISASSAADPEFVERFRREAKALAALSHPNIVTVYDGGVADGRPYLAMELVEGVSLRSLLAERRLPPREALAIVPQLCDALEYAHDAGIVHRDIKPENILVDRTGRVKIADFGIAKLVREPERTLTQTNMAIGTPAYMAPEQFSSAHDVDHRADIYSMGVVFYEMLTGDVPRGRFAPPSKKAPVHHALDEIVMKALEERPEQRYQRAQHVKRDVTSFTATPPPPATPRRSRIAVASLVLAVLGLVVPYLLLRLSPAPQPIVGCGLIALLVGGAVVAAIVALVAIGSSHGRLRGRAWAWPALAISLVAMLGLVVVLMPLQQPEADRAQHRLDTEFERNRHRAMLARAPEGSLSRLWPIAGESPLPFDFPIRRAEEPIAILGLLKEMGIDPERVGDLKRIWHSQLGGGNFELTGFEFEEGSKVESIDHRPASGKSTQTRGRCLFELRSLSMWNMDDFRLHAEQLAHWLDTRP